MRGSGADGDNDRVTRGLLASFFPAAIKASIAADAEPVDDSLEDRGRRDSPPPLKPRSCTFAYDPELIRIRVSAKRKHIHTSSVSALAKAIITARQQR